MQFYTNVTPWGNSLLVREYVNGERINRKVKYSPTLYCKVIKETNYKTLDGQYVTPIKHQTIKEAREWLKSYQDQPHLVFGNTLFQYNYISDSYDCIFTLTNEDSHFEHRTVNNMTPALVRHKKIGIISYRTPSTLDTWIPNFYVGIDLDEKIEYLKMFESQLYKPYFSEKSIKSFHSNYQCSKKNMEYVELFRIEGIYSK